MINLISNIAAAITGTKNWILKILITLLLILVVLLAFVILPFTITFLIVRKLYKRSAEW